MLTSVSQRNVVAARPARSAVVVRAQTKPETPKENVGSAVAKVASHALASAVSAALLVSSVAPSAVQAAVPIQNQGESIEVAFNFGSQDGPSTEAARIGPVETAQRAADKLNNVTNNVFGDVPQKSGANFNNNAGNAPNPSVTKDAFGRDIGPGNAMARGTQEVKNATSGAANQVKNAVNGVATLQQNPGDIARNTADKAKDSARQVGNQARDAKDKVASDAKGNLNALRNKVAFNFGQNPADAAKDAADKAAGGAQDIANKAGSAAQKVSDTAKTPVSQRPTFQDAQDKLFPTTGNNSSAGKPQTNKFAQVSAGNGEFVAFGVNPVDAAKNLGDKAASIGQGIQNQASQNAEGLQNRASNISQGAQNKSATAAGNAFNSATNTAQNKADSAASSAKGLFNSATNSAQNKADDASSTAKGLFNNVKQTAATPVSQRPNLQDAQDKLFPTTGNNSTAGKPQVTKDAFGRDINQLRRVNGPGQAIPRELEDDANAAGRAVKSLNPLSNM